MEDLRSVRWNRAGSNNSISYGCYMKVHIGDWYYKLSNYDSSHGFYGDESIYEVISSRFLRKLGFDCVGYKLVRALVRINGVDYVTFACKSKDFSKGYSSKMTFESLREQFMQLSVDEFITRLGFSDTIRKIIIADFMIIGRDRHGANIEVLLSNAGYKIAPIFDNGLSLLCSVSRIMPDYESRVKLFDSLYDYRVNNYIGSQSLYANLSYINKPIHVNKLLKTDKRSIFYGINQILPKCYIDKIWEILVYRYMYLRQKGFIEDDEKI